MNTTSLNQYVENYKKWYSVNQQEAQFARAEQQSFALQYLAYTKERLESITVEDLYNYIAPLWSMAIWGNKQYQINNIIDANGMPLLREQLAKLMHGTSSIEKRWDEFRSKIKGVGPAIMSELLLKTHPTKYLYWSKRTFTAFNLIGIENLPRYDYQLTGEKYRELCEVGHKVLDLAQSDKCPDCDEMMGLNYFLWQSVQKPINGVIIDREISIIDEKPLTKEDKFVHNDVRDKLAEIGRFLGFSSEVEKKVADGAIVDTIWEVTIGNMGRVIYVFEVQTAGSIDSLILNLMKAKNNKAVQGIVAVSDQKQIEKIKKEVSALSIKSEIKFWDYTEVLKVHESLQYVNETINNLGLVPLSL